MATAQQELPGSATGGRGGSYGGGSGNGVSSGQSDGLVLELVEVLVADSVRVASGTADLLIQNIIRNALTRLVLCLDAGVSACTPCVAGSYSGAAGAWSRGLGLAAETGGSIIFT